MQRRHQEYDPCTLRAGSTTFPIFAVNLHCQGWQVRFRAIRDLYSDSWRLALGFSYMQWAQRVIRLRVVDFSVRHEEYVCKPELRASMKIQ
jgi:hypothetical protein